MSELESLGPVRAVRMYLETRQDGLTDWTLKPRKCRLRAFIEWCEESGVNDLTELDGRDLYEFCIWRREGNFSMENGETPEEIAPVTLKSQLTTLQAFLRFTTDIHVAPEGFYGRVPLPKLSGADDVDDSTLGPDRTTDILEYPRCYHYAFRRHVKFTLLWEAGVRTDTIHGLDLHDLDLDSRTPVVRYKHRPDRGTPIKNGEEGERSNSVSGRADTMLQAYIDGPRVGKTDRFGRRPLLATSHRRVSAGTIRQDVHVVTRPYWLSQGCPHNRDIEMCKAVELNHVGTCPSSRSPHDVRRGVATLYRRKEMPRRVVSNRLDASDLVLDKHYDRHGERERAEQRRDHLP